MYSVLYTYLIYVVSCQVFNNDFPDLFLVTSDSIKFISLKNSSVSNITLIKQDDICSAYYISKLEKLCFTLCDTPELYQLYINGSYASEPELIGKIENTQFSIDWINLKLYTFKRKWVVVYELDNSKQKTFGIRCQGLIWSLALDPLTRQMYWSCLENKTHYIGNVGMDGSMLDVVIDDGVGVPLFVMLDNEMKRVYWLEVRRNQIRSSSYNGTDIVIHVNDLSSYLVPIGLYKNNLILQTELDGRPGVYFCDKVKASNCSLIYPENSINVIVYDSYNQPSAPNPCTDRCEEFCLLSPNPPYYSCQCPDHYYTADGTTCEAVPNFLVSGNSYIRIIDIKGQIDKKLNFFEGSDFIRDIEFLYNKNIVFWSSLYTGIIGMMELNDRVDKPAMINTKYANFLAVDWATSNIYWTSKISKAVINVVTLDGRYNKQLITYEKHKCIHILFMEVDAIHGYLFWQCASTNVLVCIRMSSMNGYYNVSNVLCQKRQILDFSLDRTKNRVYWISRSQPFLETVHYDGTHHRIIITELPYHLKFNYESYSLTNLEYFVYFAIGRKRYYISKSDSTEWYRETTPVNENIHRFKAYHHSLQPEVRSPCSINNGNCSHLCLLSSEDPYYTCECPDGYVIVIDNVKCKNRYPCTENNGGCSHICIGTDELPFFYCKCLERVQLKSDNATCNTSFDHMFLVTTSRGIWTVIADGNLTYNRKLSHVHGTRINSAYDPAEQHIYWSDSRGNSPSRIQRSLLNGSDKAVISSTGDDILDITVDWIGRKLYYTSLIQAKRETDILVSNMDGSVRQTFVDKGNPTALGLDQFNGYLFYWISSVIHKIGTDGEDHFIILQSGCIPTRPWLICTFTIDSKYYRMFWFFHGKIQVANLDGTGQHAIVTDKPLPAASIYATGEILYFAHGSDIRMMNTSEFTNTSTVVYSIPGHTIIHTENIAVLHVTDESQKCSQYASCLGLREYTTCLSSRTICDGIDDCYDGHDEIYCHICANNLCFVEELSLVCTKKSADISKTEIATISKLVEWKTHPFSKIMVLENLLKSECRLDVKITGYDHVEEYIGLRNLHIRSMTIPRVFRQILASRTLRNLEDLMILNISGNQLKQKFNDKTFLIFEELRVLSVINSRLNKISKTVLSKLKNLYHLNISYNAITVIESGSFDSLVSLLSIDFRGNDIQFTPNLFKMTQQLTHIYSSSFTFCCIKPSSVADLNCEAPEDSFSNCSDLIKYDVLKIILWVMGFLAVAINISALLIHFLQRKQEHTSQSFTIFVSNLEIADAVMGIYMMIIAAHDLKFRGLYFENKDWWTQSELCEVCGILAIGSSEASVLFICLITIDRFLAVRYPFKTIEISDGLAFILSIIVWLISLVIAIIPTFLYDTFYSKSGVCIALPLTADITDDFVYSATLFLGINFVLFLIILIGQIAIYKWVLHSSLVVSAQYKSRISTLAKFLFTVALTDALCWIPIAVLGILSINGIPISNDVYAWIVVFVFPINSTINPFIYTFVAICRVRQKKKTSSK